MLDSFTCRYLVTSKMSIAVYRNSDVALGVSIENFGGRPLVVIAKNFLRGCSPPSVHSSNASTTKSSRDALKLRLPFWISTESILPAKSSLKQAS